MALRAEPTWSCWEFSTSPSHTPRQKDDHGPTCPRPQPLVPHVSHREEKDLGSIMGRQEIQKLNKTPWTQGPKKELQGGPTHGFLGACKSQAGRE